MGTLLRRIAFAILATMLMVASAEVRHEHKTDGPCDHCIAVANRRRFLAGLVTPRELYPASIDAQTASVFAHRAEQAIATTVTQPTYAQPRPCEHTVARYAPGLWSDWPPGAPAGRAPPSA